MHDRPYKTSYQEQSAIHKFAFAVARLERPSGGQLGPGNL
jgi:hypothetical protein